MQKTDKAKMWRVSRKFAIMVLKRLAIRDGGNDGIWIFPLFLRSRKLTEIIIDMAEKSGLVEMGAQNGGEEITRD